MTTVNLYRVFCIQENTNVYVWGTSPPTMCPNNHSNRALNESLTTVTQKVESTSVIATDDAPSNGHYQITCQQINIPETTANVVTTYNNPLTTFPYDVYIWTMTCVYTSESFGDTVNMGLGIGTPIGMLVANATSGSNTITVSDTVMGYIGRGLELTIANSTNSCDTGIITNIDTVNNIITFVNPLTFSFSASSTLVKLNRYTVRNYVLDPSESIKIGNKGLKAMLVPANTPFSFSLTNTGGNNGAKKIFMRLECYMV